MARPRKELEDKRDKRLTFYMTEEERARLDAVAAHLRLDKTKVIAQALDQYIHGLESHPEALSQALVGDVVKSQREEGRGYVCSHGHPFWIDADWPSPPEICPLCGDRILQRTWDGQDAARAGAEDRGG